MGASCCVLSSLNGAGRIDTLAECSGDSGAAENSWVKGSQTDVQLCSAPLHNASPRAPPTHTLEREYFKIVSEEEGDSESHSNPPAQRNHCDSTISNYRWKTDSGFLASCSPDGWNSIVPMPTLLEAQFARDLARDYMGPLAPIGCAEKPQAVGGQFGSVSGNKVNYPGGLCANFDPCATQSPKGPGVRYSHSRYPTDALAAEHSRGRRRHSIITLQPMQEGSASWSALSTRTHRRQHIWDSAAWPGEHVAASKSGGVNIGSKMGLGTGSHPTPLGKPLYRHETSHLTEFQLFPSVLETSGAGRREDSQDWQRSLDVRAGGEKSEARTISSSAATHRSSSVEALRERGMLTMKERVAFFEEKLSRHQARMEAEAQNLVRLRRNSDQEEMTWPSRRGPLRLEAIYKIRLPLIVDESGTPWGRAPIIGPGKPENQNHAIAFSRMDTMQVMDMNMESYLEEAMKLRNLLQEFALNGRMRILGKTSS